MTATEVVVETAVAASLTALAPTEAPTPTWTWTPGTPTPEPTSTPTFTPLPTPIPPPGIYVTNIRLDPPYPFHRQDVRFFVTFLNTTNATQYRRWFVFIYRSGQGNPFGQTSSDNWPGDNIAPGEDEIQTLDTWKIFSGGEPCRQYWAKVNWFVPDTGAKPEFTYPNGQEFAQYFWVCPPGEGTPTPSE